MPPAVASFDPAPPLIHLVVERRGDLIEPPSDHRCEPLRLIRVGKHHEVVAADVPDEPIRAAAPRDLSQHLGDTRDHPVAARETVVVVELLEVINVDVEQRERVAARKARLDLFGDRRVPGKAGQRAQRSQTVCAADRSAEPRQELVRVVGLGDVVVCAGPELGDLRLELRSRAQEHDRQEAGARIPPHDLAHRPA